MHPALPCCKLITGMEQCVRTCKCFRCKVEEHLHITSGVPADVALSDRLRHKSDGHLLNHKS